jgi:hypothetical protein
VKADDGVARAKSGETAGELRSLRPPKVVARGRGCSWGGRCRAGAKRGEEGLGAFCAKVTHASGRRKVGRGVRFGTSSGGGGRGGHAE